MWQSSNKLAKKLRRLWGIKGHCHPDQHFLPLVGGILINMQGGGVALLLSLGKENVLFFGCQWTCLFRLPSA